VNDISMLRPEAGSRGWSAEECITAIDAQLEVQLCSFEVTEPLTSAIRYSLFPGGKRIRPLFSLLLCRDLGGRLERLLPAAVLIEYLHCASLIHDDLPSLDNDDMRRGRAACHRVFGEATALLAGDALIPMAFESLARAPLEAVLQIRLMKGLGRAYRKLCAGQQLDLLPAEKRGELSVIHSLKTGALFEAAALFAAAVAGLGEIEAKSVEELGVAIGLYFQLVDDYVDVFGSNLQRGREGSSDKRNQKATHFTAESSEQAKGELVRIRLSIDEALKTIGCTLARPGLEFEGARYVVNTIAERMPRP
jgi:geranylgeranyl diphosphate synthase, type II